MMKNMKYPIIKTLNSNDNSIVHLFAFLFCFVLLSGCGGEIETGLLSGGGGGVGGTKSVVLSWESPTTNDDATCLSDLGGYRLYYNDTGGVSKATYVNYYTISINSPSLACDAGVPVACGNIRTCTYTAQGLTAGTWYFAATAYDTSGNESIESNIAQKDVL
jgi:hypothetical protein